MSKDIIVGTAGHIDHGKTALVKALTGVDADRLPEEKQRGITIDIGFAELDLGDVRIGFVDVPGHEKFVKNMLAGASGIDAVLLVVAADEGVMPQTREHFEICRLLDIKTGIVALTKSDLVDDETLALARLDVIELIKGSFLDAADIIPVSSKTGDGIASLRYALENAGAKVGRKNEQLVSRLAIDRSFSVKGHGAVVTGTVASGKFTVAQELELLPSLKNVKIRAMQNHGRQSQVVSAGQRAAINLGGIDSLDVVRGMVLAERHTLQPTQIIDTEVEVLLSANRPLKSRQRVRISVGTVEALARVQILNADRQIEPGERDLAQFRIETFIVATPGERFIIRSYSPQTTIAGGYVIDPLATRHRGKDIPIARDLLQRLTKAADPTERLAVLLSAYGDRGANSHTLQARSGLRKTVLDYALDKNIENGSIVRAGELFVDSVAIEKLKATALDAIGEFHKQDPLAKGMLRETLRERVFGHVDPSIFRTVLSALDKQKLVVPEGESVRLATHDLELSPIDTEIKLKLARIYDVGFDVPKLDEALEAAAKGAESSRENTRKIFQLLIDENRIVKVSDEFYFSRQSIENLKSSLRLFANSTSDRLIDVPKFKEIAGISRKYAIPLLEYFDREKVTVRAGDKRLIL